MWFAFFIRSGPVTLDGLDTRVEQGVLQNVQQLITQDISKNYPNLNQAYQQELVLKEYQKVLESRVYSQNGQEINIDNLIETQIKLYKSSFQTLDNQTYLTAIDPYYFFRKAENFAQNGHQGEVLINGTSFETKTLALKYERRRKY